MVRVRDEFDPLPLIPAQRTSRSATAPSACRPNAAIDGADHRDDLLLPGRGREQQGDDPVERHPELHPRCGSDGHQPRRDLCRRGRGHPERQRHPQRSDDDRLGSSTGRVRPFTTYTSTAEESRSAPAPDSVLVDAALTGLTVGTTYYYRVAAGNDSGTTRGGI